MLCLMQLQSAGQSDKGQQSQPFLLNLLNTFEMMPPSGQLKPGERVNVQVKFVPAAEVVAVDCCDAHVMPVCE